ncbi:MAG: hypothetical protein WEF99_12985 [Thermoanaerobaculia bacterium]
MTRERSFKRKCGIPRAAATVTIERVEGPSAQRSRVRPKETEMPTSCWISRAMCSATWPSQVPSATRFRNPPAAPSEQ